MAVKGAKERGDALIDATADRVGIPRDQVWAAIDYYAHYPDEIDAWVEANELAAVEYERVLENRERILG